MRKNMEETYKPKATVEGFHLTRHAVDAVCTEQTNKITAYTHFNDRISDPLRFYILNVGNTPKEIFQNDVTLTRK